MRTALGLIMIVSGIIAVRSAFAANPDPREFIRDLFAGTIDEAGPES